jgi:ATP-dependent Clp protease ATP-binding subunit ClpX
MFGHQKNSELLEIVNQKVYGHLEAKKALINAFNRALIRQHQEFNLRHTQDLLPLRNTLLIGDSGTGKTFLVETLAKICDFHLIVVDATQIVPSGGSGKINVEGIVKKITDTAKHESELLNNLYCPEECMRRIVVFIDEIDKLGYSFEGSGNWNKHVQSNLLQLVEEKAGVKGVTFVFAGAFDGMLKEKTEKKHLGFTHNHKEEKNEEVDWATQVINAGLIPELVGRISSIVKLDDLSPRDYFKIAKSYIIPLHNETLRFYSYYDFKINKKKLDEIIAKTIKSRQGVRYLKREIEKISSDIEFNFENHIQWSLLE